MNTQTTMLMLLTLIQGLGAGICVDVALIKLPARQHIGPIAYANFARGNDLGNGLKVYPYVVVGGGFLVIVFTVVAHFQKLPLINLCPLYIAAGSAFGYLLATAKAAPVMWSLRNTPDEENILKAKLDKFARWHVVRTTFQIIAFMALIWALESTSNSGIDIIFISLLFTTFIVGLMTGICFDVSLVKLPTRHRIGVLAYADFARGNDLGNGIVVYPVVSISGALLLIATTIIIYGSEDAELLYLLYSAILTTILSFVGTAKAAPIMLSLKNAPRDEKILKDKLDKFTQWNAFRTVFQMITFLLMLWATSQIA
jgi:hypothetical protein